MITLSNGHSFEFMVASGALGFDGGGWLHEKPLITAGLMKPEWFTVVLRTLTLKPRLYPVCNLSWLRPWTWLPWSPWSCVKFLPDGGAINKVGLYNPGIEWWCSKVGPYLNYDRYNLIVSIFGSEEELVRMAIMLNPFPIKGIEVNDSCPNAIHPQSVERVGSAVKTLKAVKAVSRHPILYKGSVDLEYLAISLGLKGIAEAFALNSVPFWIAFPGAEKTPLWRLNHKGPGGGGVSGKPAQKHNWRAVTALAKHGPLPVIGPSIMEFDDIRRVEALGAKAKSFGAIHLRSPCKPTEFVERIRYENR